MANKWDLSEAGKAWQKEYQQGYRNKISTINIKIRKDSGILEALDEACLVNNVFRVEYLRLAVCKKRGMRRDIRHLPLTTPE